MELLEALWCGGSNFHQEKKMLLSDFESMFFLVSSGLTWDDWEQYNK